MDKRLELLAELSAVGFQTLSVKEFEAIGNKSISPKRFILGAKIQVELGVLIYCLGSGKYEGMSLYFLRRQYPALVLDPFKIGVLGRSLHFGETQIPLQDLIALG